MTQNFGRYTLDNRSYSEHKYFSPNHRCKLTQILVSPRSALKSPTSSHFAMFSDGSCSNHSCQSKYSILTSKSKVKNLLLDVGSEIRYRHDIKGKTTSDKAAIMFQSTWRRYNVLREIALKEKERISLKFTLLQELEEINGGWKRIGKESCVNYKMLYNITCKEIKSLVSILLSTKTREKERESIFKLFVSCFKQADKTNINRYDVILLFKQILRFNLDRFEIYEIINSSSIKSNISSEKLFKWLIDYTAKNTTFNSCSAIDVIKSMFLGDTYPESFVKSFISIKASVYDRIYTIYNFEKKNPPQFKCPVCNMVSTKPMVLAKHIHLCRKNLKQ